MTAGITAILDYNIRFIIISERFNIMSVKVAIRVRPFNQREKFLGCISCVDMRQNTTILYQNRQKNKKQHYFTFDYSLWSHDDFLLREDGYMSPASHKYVDQQKVYNLIGREILDNAWQGYNCCLFAYGQTGAGKSYSMIGYGVNRGIIPMVCEEIFQRIKKFQRKGEKQFEISLSMLEIYNEKVQDLFVSTSKRPQNGLKIRQNKTLGVYVEGLTKHQVHSYTDIERRMDEGSKNRSLASTLMNQYSSRAHTIIIIEFIQKEWINKLKMNKKSSFINLVDLAGSERVAKTGIIDNKDRLKEASNINKSLHTLGRVIEILAEQSAGKKNVQVPYRDSSLTRILETALGGNSKTIMICAISPANDNYEQTLSTLRYADQTKKIKNKPIVNESAVDKIIRELRQQNERLKKMLEAPEESPIGKDIMSDNEKKQLRSNVRASMREVQKEIKKNLKSFAINTEQIDEQEDSLMMTEFIDLEEPSQFFSQLSFDLGNKAQVYITNLNEDELLNFKVRYSCEKDILITNKNNKKLAKGMENFAKIVLCGLGIEQNHARITRNKDKYYIEALSETSSEYTLLNGKPVSEKRQLQHNDRIILGINSVFIFKNNLRKKDEKEKKIDYEFVINERQQEMENLSLISPTSLNLFLSSNLMRNSPSRDIYAGPPIQAYNNTKKLFEQQNDAQILEKLSEIEKQFSKLVKENEEKIKEKEDFYRSKLTELKKQKEKEKEEKSTLQEKLMIKSIQSETLRSKNSELQKLKQKLSKYNDEKNRRKKFRQSMLLVNDDDNGVIEQDIIGQFVDLEDPNVKRAHQIGIGPDGEIISSKKRKKDIPPKNNRNSFNYEEVTVEEYQDNDDVINKIALRKQSNDSLLLLDQQPFERAWKKSNKQKQIQKLQELKFLKEKNEKMRKEIQSKRIFQFRRLYNIKIKCEVQVDSICTQCLKTNELKSLQLSHPIDNSFITKYLPNSPAEDAQLEEYSYKGKEKKKTISHEEMLFLQQQIIELQSKLLAKQAVSSQERIDNDEMLLNLSIERIQQGLGNRTSFAFPKSRDSYADFDLNLTQDFQFSKSKSELKIMVNDFIQILADTPELKIFEQSSLKVLPTPRIKPQLKQNKLQNFSFSPNKRQNFLTILSPSALNIQIASKRPYREFQFLKNQQFHYSTAVSIQKLEKNYKIQNQSPSLNETQLLNDLNCEEDEVYEEQIVIKKKTQTKSKSNTKQPEKIIEEVKQFSDAQANVDIPKENDKIFCQFGINTEVNDYESNDKEKMNSFTAFLTEEFEQTRQNNTQMDNTHSNENTEMAKQYVEIGVNSDKNQEFLIEKDSIQVQVEVLTAEMDAVTDINMQTYEEFRTNNQEIQPQQASNLIQASQIQHVNIQEKEQALLDEYEKIEREAASEPNNQGQLEGVNEEQLLEKYLEEQQQISEKKDKSHNQNSQGDEIEKYLQKPLLVDRSINTSQDTPIQLVDCGINPQKLLTNDQKMNTQREQPPQQCEIAVNTSVEYVNPSQAKPIIAQNEEEIQNYLQEQQDEQQLNNYLQEKPQNQPKLVMNEDVSSIQRSEVDNQIQSQKQLAKYSQIFIQNKMKSLYLISRQLDHVIYEEKSLKNSEIKSEIIQSSPELGTSPIDSFFKEPLSSKSINQFKAQRFDLVTEAIKILIDSKAQLKAEQIEAVNQSSQVSSENQSREKVEMIDEQIQTSLSAPNFNPRKNSADHNVSNEDSHNKSNSNEIDAVGRKREKSYTQFDNKQKDSSQQFVDKFNLSFSEIEKHELSYQEMSVMGFDGLLKEDELNSKIKLLEDKIKELESQQQETRTPSQSVTTEAVLQSQPEKIVEQPQPIENDDILEPEIDKIDINASLLAFSRKDEQKSTSRYIPIKKNKKKKKRAQMTQQQKKEHEIEKEIQAKIIQCNNENIINQRNLQIHKRKREAEQLRKILIKKEKVELQKQLLLLIPMIRRFNLIAKDMKRLVEAKISVQYRNFSHYEMIEVLKSYSAKKSGTNNIQIKIVVLNCEEGRIYTWPSDVFKNRFQIAEQIFEKYLESSEDTRSIDRDERNEKAKDPFWDPIDFIPQGIGYLSMQVLLYNLSYEGYVSLIYKSNIIAKIYISIAPVKVKKHSEREEQMEEEESELDHIEIFNIRSLIEKDLYFTISIESIKFMKNEERQKLDDSSQNINLNSLNSNILRYSISYELLEMDYKLVTFSTHEVDFVADKQFKRIDYMRRHSFQNISESTLAYMSDCPIKFTLNVMKDYNEEVLNASFNNEEYSEDNEHSELDKSITSLDDKSSVRSRQNSEVDLKELALKKGESKKSDFSKKPAVIYENTELITKLETEAKKEQQKRDKLRKLEESRSKHGKAEKGEKDKECSIY